MNRLRLLIVAVVATALLALSAGSALAARPGTGAPINLPVTGTAQTTAGATGTLTNGNFALQRFQVVNGTLQAVGTLTGTVIDSVTGATLATLNQPVSLPVNLQQSTGSCQILDLVLGPLDLNLLGLVVHLDTVHLNVTAQQGPGNLLGNLLCAVAGLLDNTGSPLGGIAGLLNQILGILRGL